MQNALSSALRSTLTSHFQPGASLRNTAVCGSMRLATTRTRRSIAASRLSVPACAPPGRRDDRRDLAAVAVAGLMTQHAADHGAAYGAGTASLALGVDLFDRLDHAAVLTERRDRNPGHSVGFVGRACLVELANGARLRRLARRAADPAHHGGDGDAAEHNDGKTRDPDQRVQRLSCLRFHDYSPCFEFDRTQ